MDKIEYEDRIRELENQIKIMQERYQILVETTPALLFEYRPADDRMIFNFNFPGNQSRRVIENYHEYLRVSPLVHPDHLKEFSAALQTASTTPTCGELEYLSKVSNGQFEWHKTYYSSIADQSGKVISVLGRIQNIHKMATKRQEMIHRVESDFLTGLYNKGAATEKIIRWMKNNSTKEAHLVMVDLDNFKQINDLKGHAFGDEVLKETARVIKECFATNSICSRFGGDEFIIFVMDEPIRNVECHIDELMQRMEKEITGADEPIRCSAGIAARASKQDDFEELFNRADNAMYMAKKNGKNRYFIDWIK